ncbi:MAG: type II toxin-antitoxin system Phd/YefM family antitoxin [Acidobacteria bacterium]|nr:type II toxin-antitoxin system Phd/YefM family antitoxin [Acidobacteriota bacterium]
MSTKEARGQLSQVISRAAFAKERIVLTRHGKAVAAVVPLEDLKLREELADHIDIEDARAVLIAACRCVRFVERRSMTAARRSQTASQQDVVGRRQMKFAIKMRRKGERNLGKRLKKS